MTTTRAAGAAPLSSPPAVAESPQVQGGALPSPTSGPSAAPRPVEPAPPVERATSTFEPAPETRSPAAANLESVAAPARVEGLSQRERNLGAWAQALFVPPAPAPAQLEALPVYAQELSSDGKLLVRGSAGAGLAPAGTGLEGLRSLAFAPPEGVAVKPGPLTLFITGIQTTADSQAKHAQALAEQGHHVIAVRNATRPASTVAESAVRDALQARADVALADVKDIGGVDPATVNPAIRSLALTMTQALRAGRPVHMVGHSQGAAIISAALTLVKHVIDGAQPSPPMVDPAAWTAERAVMAKAFEASNVESLGGFARRYPPGPTYLHFINHGDTVPQAPSMEGGLLTGTPDEAEVLARAGGDKATLVLFDHPGSGEPVIGPHALGEAYLAARKDLGELKPGGPRLRLNVPSVEQALSKLGLSSDEVSGLLAKRPLMGFGWNQRGFKQLLDAIRWERVRFPHVPAMTYLDEALRQGKRDHGGVTRFIQQVQAQGVEFDEPREVFGGFRVRVTVKQQATPR